MKEIQNPSIQNTEAKDMDSRLDALWQEYQRLSKQIDALQQKMENYQREADQHAGRIVRAVLEDMEKKEREEAILPREKGKKEGTSLEVQLFPSKEQQNELPDELPKRRSTKPPATNRKKKRVWKIVGNVAFYGVLVLVVLIALFIRSTGDGAPRSLAGFTGMIVLSESMQSEIPKGSLVISQQVDPNALEIGDDITFMANQTTTVTHRIVGIIENYEDTGQRAFETQGVMNAQPDANPVPAVNVVGKVVFHSEILGQVASFITGNWPILLLAAVVIIVLMNVLGRIYRKEPSAGSHAEP